MPKRRKPEGTELERWCRSWDEADHEGKMRLAQESDVSYDTAKHWRSESTDVVPRKEAEPKMQVTVEQLLNRKSAINLDFVSFDIESSNLTADYSILLSAVIKPFGQEPIVFRADDYQTWVTDRANDKELTQAIAEELRKHAIVITHYGMYFDIPYFRAKMEHHGLEPLPQMFAIDSWRIAYKNFKVSSRRLKNLATYFDLGEKSNVEGELWMDAAYNGSKEAMDEIVEHNIQDCVVLEKLAAVSFPYLKSIPRM